MKILIPSIVKRGVNTFNNIAKSELTHTESFKIFFKQLTKQGESYTAQYLSQVEFDKIING